MITNDYNLFLDDFRHPYDAYTITKDTDFLQLKWVVVRSHDEFVEAVEKRFEDGSFPIVIAFDHDLADDHYDHTVGDFPYDEMKEKTGMHSVKWLVDFCIDHNLKLPSYKVHSQNPGGAANIEGLLSNFKKHQDKNGI